MNFSYSHIDYFRFYLFTQFHGELQLTLEGSITFLIYRLDTSKFCYHMNFTLKPGRFQRELVGINNVFDYNLENLTPCLERKRFQELPKQVFNTTLPGPTFSFMLLLTNLHLKILIHILKSKNSYHICINKIQVRIRAH